MAFLLPKLSSGLSYYNALGASNPKGNHMLFMNIERKYYSQADDGSQGGGGGTPEITQKFKLLSTSRFQG